MNATETAQENVNKITTAANSDPSLEGFIKRSTRDAIIVRELEAIKNTSGDDRAKYIDRVVAAAEKSIDENKVDLAKLKQLREDPNSNPADIKALFDNNPKLVEARAYLIIAASFGDKSKFADYLDNDGSTAAMISSLSAKVQEGLTNTDAKSGLDSIHAGALKQVEDQQTLVLQYLASLSTKTKEETPPENGNGNTPAPTTSTPPSGAAPAPATTTDKDKADKPEEKKDKPTTSYDATKIPSNVTAKAFLGMNNDIQTWATAHVRVNDGVVFDSKIRFKDPVFGNPNRDGTTDYIRGDNGKLLAFKSPTDILRELRTTPEIGDNNYFQTNYTWLGIYRIGSVRVNPEDYVGNPAKLDKSLQDEVRRFLASDEKALPVFVVNCGKGWFKEGLEGQVVYLPREEVIKQFGLAK